jgi:hypothetical protein
MAFTLSIHSIGTTDTVVTQHDSLADAQAALKVAARHYDIQGDINSTTVGGTLTSKTGTVNQAAYVWNIRKEG